MTSKRETTVQVYVTGDQAVRSLSYDDAVRICETLTEKEIDMLLVANNPLGRICLDIEIIDGVLDEQADEEARIEEEIEASIRESLEAEMRIEEEVRKAIEEADYEKVKAREDAWALAEVT